jgi:stage II sporulation protein R
MRGKFVVWSYLLVLSFATILNLYMPKTEAAEKESIVIPGEAIRLRILANSDFEKDQAIKRKVRDAVNAQITLWVQDLTSMEKAREVLNAKLPEIQTIAEKVVLEQGSDQSVKVEFGEVQFPTKLYGQYLYPAGKYQAILITLGKGEGANWWCVLYPPLCFLDFSNGVAVSEGFDEGETAQASSSETEKETIGEMAIKQPQKKETVVKPQNKESVAKPGDNDRPVVKEEPKPVIEKAEPVGENETEQQDSDVKEEAKKQKADKAEKPSKDKKKKSAKKSDPVYVSEDEKPVKVKFFVVEMFEKIF